MKYKLTNQNTFKASNNENKESNLQFRPEVKVLVTYSCLFHSLNEF